MKPHKVELSLGLCLVLIALFALACNDDTNNNNGTPSPEAGQEPSDTPAPTEEPSPQEPSAEEPSPEEPSPGEPAPGEPEPPMRECQARERECGDSPTSYRVCQPDGQWFEGECERDFVCRPSDGSCIPNPDTCVPGERVCLGSQEPAECLEGGGWSPLPQCDNDEGCAQGTCQSRECADAILNASYVGCDYMALESPNGARTPIGLQSTPDSPIAIVLANPSQNDSANFWVFEPGGSLADLVAERTIDVPPLAFGDFQPVTVRTEIRDRDGFPVVESFPRANGAEIPPGGMAIILLPPEPPFLSTTFRSQAHRISTNKPVAAYQFSPYCCNYTVSNDASLLLPVSTLGTDYMYLGPPSWSRVDENNQGDPNPTVGTFPAMMTIAAPEDNTDVTVTLRNSARVQADAQGTVQIQGNVITFSLEQNETLNLATGFVAWNGGRIQEHDMTGARITSTKPVAVFSGHVCSFYPHGLSACDHLEEQLFPTDTWGRDFALVPLAQRNESPTTREATYWKFLAQRDNTNIELSVPFLDLEPLPPGYPSSTDCRDKLQGDRTIVLNEGEFCEFGTRLPTLATSNQPTLIMGILSGQDSTGLISIDGANAGDPAIFLVPPRRQYRTSYPFLAPTTYFVDYITVITETGASLTLDGESVDLSSATTIPGSTLIFQHIVIEDGTHLVESNTPFGIVSYAYDDYVSYAFTGGLNLIKQSFD